MIKKFKFEYEGVKYNVKANFSLPAILKENVKCNEGWDVEMADDWWAAVYFTDKYTFSFRFALGTFAPLYNLAVVEDVEGNGFFEETDAEIS